MRLTKPKQATKRKIDGKKHKGEIDPIIAPNKRKRNQQIPAQTADMFYKRKKAVDMKIHGYNYREIGDSLGISHVRAHQIVTEELRKVVRETREDAAVVLQVEIERLNRMTKLHTDGMERGARDDRRLSAEAGLRVVERRCKMLGLDAPTKIQDVTKEEIEAAFAVIVPIFMSRLVHLTEEQRQELAVEIEAAVAERFGGVMPQTIETSKPK